VCVYVCVCVCVCVCVTHLRTSLAPIAHPRIVSCTLPHVVSPYRFFIHHTSYSFFTNNTTSSDLIWALQPPTARGRSQVLCCRQPYHWEARTDAGMPFYQCDLFISQMYIYIYIFVCVFMCTLVFVCASMCACTTERALYWY